MGVLQWPKRQSCKPGQLAPVSGIYRAIHVGHRSPHEVLVIAGEALPYCRTCTSKVSFEVVLEVRHVTLDFDLAGPPNLFEDAA